MSGSLPFYQKHHRHYDRGYRSKELESALSQYRQSSTYSARSSSISKGAKAAVFSEVAETDLGPIAKKSKPTYLAFDKENQIIGYVVPLFKGSQEFASGLSDTEEARMKETAGYLARRELFSSELKEEKVEMHQTSRRVAMRESAERMVLKKTIYENEEFHRRMNEDHLMYAPRFVIKPRSHMVWEKQSVRLHCTVSGWPEPRVV
ncbi:hypothetical protein COCON_G00068640 [Conger conger]|uniref:Uncharacterized protein n=3 Tax=Conger conger TaxID=82655 RepID=A0A9Q1I4B1_CONCO|nr:hypothetical protein COCON_G00068640 [Conger conger]